MRAEHPEYNGIKTYKIPAADALQLFAAKHPDLPRDVALNKEAKKNLVHYSTTQPVAFAKMQWAKAKRMWFFYYRGGGVHYISTAMRIWQVVLVLAAGLGLLAGLIRRRDALLGAALLTIAFSTADPHDRGLPGPLQRAADAAADRDRRRRLVPRRSGARAPSPDAGPATMPAWTSDESESGTAVARAAPASCARDRASSATARCGSAAARRSSRRASYVEAATTLPVITGILNVWQHDPPDVARDHAKLTPTTRTASCSASASATRRRRATTRAR